VSKRHRPSIPNLVAHWALAILLLMAACAPVPPAENSAQKGPVTLATRLTAAGIAGADVGYLVSDLDSGEVIAAAAPDDLFIPASTVKVVTALAALEVLGPGHRFQTTVFADGHMAADGVLDGNLWLRGGGDPLLSVQDLLALAQQLRDGGLKKVRGRFLYDESALVPSVNVDAAQPVWASYNVPLSALSLDFNRVDLHWRAKPPSGVELSLTPSLGSAPPLASRRPLDGGVPFVADDDATAWRADLTQLTGEIGREAVAVRNPAKRTAAVFRALANGLGIALPEPLAGETAPGARPEAALLSAPLIDTLRPAFRYSNNLVSELIGRAASRRLSGNSLDTAGSAEAVAKWLIGRVGSVDWTNARLLNHSGLSAESRISPRQMNAVMAAALKARYGGWGVAALLPAGGWDRALAGMFAEPRFNGRVWAKSGTMHYTKGMTGLLFTVDGRRLAFALYITDFARRQAYDLDPERHRPAGQAAARVWITRAEGVMEDLIGAWIAAE
jgi:D-alanyl-D-alanine carboxypeptidase/D-alanyl-D-alanine-endopeptidase (penicillin-binding protein 4)